MSSDAIKFYLSTDEKELRLTCILQIAPEKKQISAFSFLASDTRQLVVYAQDKHIKMVDATKMFQETKKTGLAVRIESKDFETSIAAHLDTVNDLKLSPKQFLISSSTDKSLAIWAFNKTTAVQKEEKITLFDIFTGKVNNKF